MKTTIKFIAALLFLSSCTAIQLEMVKDKDISKKIKTLEHPEKGQQLVFLPVVHLGSEEYFGTVKYAIDSLRKEDYTIIYEGIRPTKNTDSLSTDLQNRKLRKVLGFHLTTYKDSTNKSVHKALRKSRFVMQTKGNTGIDSNTDLKVDMGIDSLLSKYEETYGEIELSSCDLNTPLLAEYTCKKASYAKKKAMIQTFRDDHLSNHIIKSNTKKIAVLYGKAHWMGIYPMLIKSGFREIE